ncbi:hypothetical protein ACEV7Q_23510, partial [Vibrio parahaemolyticus]
LNITNSSRGIQHAWHFWYAVVSVLKCNAVTSVLRASPLNWALVANEKIAAKTEYLGLIVRVLCLILHFELRELGSWKLSFDLFLVWFAVSEAD